MLTDRRTITVHDVTNVKSVDPRLFQTPKDYREQPPVFAAPGVLSR
ncbi:MAG TPA: hypothetical protein VGR02_03885 [Thermoanaerobaculia bacterium]|nr:hypothetical protein [Thermoanaerobaculia bacterium]